MPHDVLTALLTGAFGLGGVISGVLLSSHFTRGTEKSRITAEDERRWLTDRRILYAKYLSLIASMLKGIDGAATFLSYDGTKPISKENEDWVKEDVRKLLTRWEDEVQFMLGEVQLLASPKVAELADRTSWALMLLIGAMESRKDYLGDIDTRQTFTEVNQASYRTLDLAEALRNAMRNELGMTEPVNAWPRSEEWLDWPWLTDRPKELDGEGDTDAPDSKHETRADE